MCLIFVGMDVLTCCGLLLCCWLVCDRFQDLLLSFVCFLLWLSPSNLLCCLFDNNYDSITSNGNDILNDLNSIHSKIKFTHENEIDNTIVVCILTALVKNVVSIY